MQPYHHWPSLKNIALEVKNGTRSARSQVELALSLAKQETLDSSISPTFIYLDVEGALAMADSIDAKIKRGEGCGDLCGIPFVVKDNIDWLGLVTTAGSPKAYSKTASKTAPVLQGLIDRGAIPIGKANMNEWAVGLTGENTHYGNIPNPHLEGCLSGGSSSGCARAVAMGVVPMALGSDTGGSIRIPAAWCGIVGLRPSSESFSLDGVVPRSRSLDVVGPLVKSLEDCDYFLGNAFTPKSSLLTPENIPKSIQIGWDPSLLNGIEDSVRKAFIQFMENAQAHPSVSFVEQTWPSFIGATDCAMTILQMEFLNDFKMMCGEVELFTENLGKPVMNELRHSASLEPKVLIKAYEQLLQFRQGMTKMFSAVDMLALPLTPCGPVEASKLPEAAKPLRELSLAMGATGLPIIGMPIFSGNHGLGLTAPCLAGIQFVGQQFQEHKLIYIVKNYLDASSWSGSNADQS
jgi:aspartyl-tRNA(Asn)/glutamyl-tRNA(Gln) amidotransferase subunit A